MHSAVPMRIAKIGHLVLAAFLLVLGVLLVADPSLQVGWKYACGVFLILLGAVKITGFLSKDLYRLAFQYDSIYGVLLIGIGLIFLVRPVLTVESTELLLGIFVFTDGIIKIQVARHARRFGISVWWLIFSLAVLATAGGLFIAIYPTDSVRFLTRFMGAVLIVEATMSACTVLSSVRVVELFALPRDLGQLDGEELTVGIGKAAFLCPHQRNPLWNKYSKKQRKR